MDRKLLRQIKKRCKEIGITVAEIQVVIVGKGGDFSIVVGDK